MKKKKTTNTQIENLKVFRQLIAEYFGLDDLRTLCFDLNIDFDNLSGEKKDSKIIALIIYMYQHGRLGDFLKTLNEHRPHAHWPAINELPEKPFQILESFHRHFRKNK